MHNLTRSKFKRFHIYSWKSWNLKNLKDTKRLEKNRKRKEDQIWKEKEEWSGYKNEKKLSTELVSLNLCSACRVREPVVSVYIIAYRCLRSYIQVIIVVRVVFFFWGGGGGDNPCLYAMQAIDFHFFNGLNYGFCMHCSYNNQVVFDYEASSFYVFRYSTS